MTGTEHVDQPATSYGVRAPSRGQEQSFPVVLQLVQQLLQGR
jgi:hypothetical protein